MDALFVQMDRGSMLTLTENAATIIQRLVTNADRGEDSGIRITSGPEGRPSGMEVDIAAEPVPGDEIVEQAGVRVFLDTDAAAALAAKELDAVVNDDAVEFKIRTR
jgi:iron-sulfur cluster assembly protein